jgi:hypothetical protein
MEFAGIKFTEAYKNLSKNSKKLNLKGEYDIVLENGDSIALIEIKYRARKDDVDLLMNKQLSIFKLLFPQYANYSFYLGIAGLAFEDDVEEGALSKGVGVLRPKGESIEILDENLRVF